MPANTPGGLPYPLPTEPIAAGADAIKNLATAIDGAPGNLLSAWVAITTFSTGYSGAVAPNIPPRVRRLGNIAVLTGLLIAGSGAGFNLCTVPVGFRPLNTQRIAFVLGPTSNPFQWEIQIDSTGLISVTGAAGPSVANTNGVAIRGTYFLD